MLAALLCNVHNMYALLKEARGRVWRYQPCAVCAEAGAGAATGALRDGGTGFLDTDEAHDPDDGASLLAARGHGAATSGAGEDAMRTNDVRKASRRSNGERAGGGRRGTRGRRDGGLRRTVSCRNK